MIKLSIIVPIFNSELYLERCLNSLLDQDFSKDSYEIICINDNSNDNTQKILKKYSIYSNIKIVNHSLNKGVSFSRNEGINIARGEYVVFCDSDDTYNKGALKKMYNQIVNEKADFLFTNYCIVSNSGKKITRNITKYYTSNPPLKSEIVQYMNLSSCAKMIKKDLFLKHSISYPCDLKRYEEYEVIPVLAFYAKKTIFMEFNSYNYFQNKNSASNQKVSDLSFFDIAFERYSKKVSDDFNEGLLYRAMEDLLYGKTLCMLKYKFPKSQIKQHLVNFKRKYVYCYDKKFISKFSLSRKVFFFCTKYNLILLLKFLAKIHSILTI